MLVNLFYILLAILGLSFLIFIHELGHYFMARRVGMRVETFAIGFGRPIYSWVKDGVKWQIGWLLFGGYVKIAGVEPAEGQDPYQISDGFFGKSPWDRIKVAAMGPLVNLAFALLAFALLWSLGGREKNFVDFTSKIGWVDPNSELYADGVRPGDEIVSYGENSFQGAKDHVYAPMTASDHIIVKTLKVDYATGVKTPMEYTVPVYPHPASLKGVLTAGITNPASYVIYDRLVDGRENPLPEGSPLKDSGIQYGDRIFWVDGEVVFSVPQLNNILSGDKVLLTIVRNGVTKLVRIPRVPVQELKLDSTFREELIDWQFESRLNNIRFQSLYALPYNLTNDAVVENAVKFIDADKQNEAFPAHPFSEVETQLLPGDKIIAVSGMPISHSADLLKALQTYRVNIIVERNPHALNSISSQTTADQDFDRQMDWSALKAIESSIGTANPIETQGDLVLLKPVAPKVQSEFALSSEKQALITAEFQERKKIIESIEDPERRSQELRILQKQEKRLLLGLPGIQDRRVSYNPGPTTLFFNVFEEIRRTLGALFSGSLNPKWISGPIGIVQVVQESSMSSLKEALYWLGAISLNLGILNLLPIPVLDGGTILMSLVEIVTRKRLPPKTLEKIVIPFAVLLIGFFIFLTYNDLSRLFQNFIH
jgi:regulator of sigma E protease